MDDPIEEWLSECRSDRTRRAYTNRIAHFSVWYSQNLSIFHVKSTHYNPLSEFLKLTPKERRHLALTYQNEALGKGMKPNSVSAVMGALGSFCSHHDLPLGLRGKRVRTMMDLSSHNFSNADLAKMFEVADTQMKALLATFLSLGWERSAFNTIGRARLEAYVLKAKETGKEFMYFLDQRPKTGAARLGVLNPLCLEWLGKWFETWKGKTPFALTWEDSMNRSLKRLAMEAQVKATGRVHTHSLRKWVMSGLSRAGFNEFQIKFVMGKTIPISDATYLVSLQREVEERYPTAYKDYLSIYARDTENLGRIETLQQEIKELREFVHKMSADIDKRPLT